jgi:lipoprotein NlpD
MAGSSRIAILLIIACALAACSSNPPAGASYTVKRGDTLYKIAQHYGLDHRDLARWNHIDRDNVIHPGQVLRLSPPGARSNAVVAKNRGGKAAPRQSTPPPTTSTPAPVGPPVDWRWPVDGGTATLTARPNGGHGLMFHGTAGQEVRCAASGRVVYSGTGLLGLGRLLIVKHNESYLSAYGLTDAVVVNEGDYVVAGQRIASMGSDSQGAPSLYFEIRINGAPGNPLSYLPARKGS